MLRPPLPMRVRRAHPPLAVYAGCACALASVAAVVSFARGGWAGIAWVLLAGLASNMTWYYARRGGSAAGKGTGTRAGAGLPDTGSGRGDAPSGCESGGTGVACGVCVRATPREFR